MADPSAAAQFSQADLNPSDTQRFNSETRDELRRRIRDVDRQNQRFHIAPTSKQLLGSWSVVGLILNRTIGSGIFTQPVNVLEYSGSSGAAILVWIYACVIVLCITACWLELGLNVPFYSIVYNGIRKRLSTPRSGGDKNYLEYIYRVPDLFMTCFFSIPFIIFGNMAGNAVQFGVLMMVVIDPSCQDDQCRDRGKVVGWAIFVLTACALINVITREFSIRLNNVFAILKVAYLVITTFLGIIYGSIHGDGCRQISMENKGGGGSFGDIMMALFFAMYPLGGYEQPFYVLAEVAQPRRNFAKAVTWTMVGLLFLYPLVNVSYMCVAPYSGNDSLPDNMALAMFARLSGAPATDLHVPNSTGLIRGAAAILAFFIFGNIMAQTFTGSRVKQEIAKEGILPWSHQLSADSKTLVAKLTTSNDRRSAIDNIEGHGEQTPIMATLLHWSLAVLLVSVVGGVLPPTKAYKTLTYTKAYTIIGVMGMLTCGGLLYLKIDSALGRKSRRKWSEKATWKGGFGPIPALFATVSLAILLFGSFAPPKSHNSDNIIKWWILPTVSWAVCSLGVAWWLGLQIIQWNRGEKLVRERIPFIEIDGAGEPVQKVEQVMWSWVPYKILVRGFSNSYV
ncbi:amino acid transporter [Coniochaeta ligniaria NRRL 30616]|uniref:Amino acid transporter n=1 Tax=Coniochaeta ligniaria NRRL 30616 TaxID=1408157 RepID=A0A1J7J4A9_9PEZI|nr:amino acid transporter [Coniochaeta ligniaria NRRL 30616]